MCDYKLINNDDFICASEKSENPKYECFLNNVSYELGCDTCLEKGIIRIVKHKRPNSVLNKHKEQNHKNEEMKVRMEIKKQFRDPLTRQANKAVRISKRSKKYLI